MSQGLDWAFPLFHYPLLLVLITHLVNTDNKGATKSVCIIRQL